MKAIMKKIFYILALVAATSLVSCDQELLNTEPSSELSKDAIFSDAGGAQMAISGIYRAMRVNSWSNGWASEHPGIFAQILVFDLMGEDHFMASQGNGWFFFDYMFNVDSDYTHSAGRQYGTWNLGYTMVSQANYVIAEKEMLEATPEGLNVLGQAYAIRAFSYMFLTECFCQGNFPVNKETCPGVPIYTEPTTKDTKGKPRGLLKDVLAQINLDYEEAVKCFEAAEKEGVGQQDVSHLDLYATKLLWARVALAEGEWQRAYDLATGALEKPGLQPVVSVKELGGFNDVNIGSLLWGFNVTADQTSPFGNFHSHMDPFNGSYGEAAPQCWDIPIAMSIPDTDERWNWIYINEEEYPFQSKFLIGDVTTSVSDNIILRGEEAVLVAAEAACRLNDWTNARKYVSDLGTVRDSEYETRLAKVTDSNLYTDDTMEGLEPVTLMEEILWQRRVELWGEGPGRLSDLKRLNLGYSRYWDGTEFEAGAPEFTFLIPYLEFQNNPELDLGEDQNPR